MSETGRELDARVTKEVIGLEVELLKATAPYLDNDDWWARSNDGKWFHVLPYSRDIATAWLLVDRLQSKGYQVFIETGFADEKDSAAVGITKKRGMGIESTPYCDIVESAETVPLAICLVALKAASIEG